MGFFYNTGDWEIHQLVISLNPHYFLPYGHSTILEDGKKPESMEIKNQVSISQCIHNTLLYLVESDDRFPWPEVSSRLLNPYITVYGPSAEKYIALCSTIASGFKPSLFIFLNVLDYPGLLRAARC